jgi:hypothetical protein
MQRALPCTSRPQRSASRGLLVPLAASLLALSLTATASTASAVSTAGTNGGQAPTARSAGVAASEHGATPKRDPFMSKLHSMYDNIEKEYRPDVRWWLAEGLNTDETLKKNIQEISDSGFGAAEFLAMPEAGAPDDVYAWGSDEWTADSKLVMEEATRLGLGFSLTSGTNWANANLPDTYTWDGKPFDPNNKAAAKSLDYTTQVVAAGKTYDAALPVPAGNRPTLDHVLQGVVAAKITKARSGMGGDRFAEGSGTGELDLSSVVDLTSKAVRNDAGYTLKWTAPTDGDYALLTYWMRGTEQTAAPSVSKNYTVNYMDSYGIDALKDYWRSNVLTPELEALLKSNGRGEIYMDSLEVNRPGAAGWLWGYNFKEEFKSRRGYDVTPYLPFISSAGGDWTDSNENTFLSKVLNDVRRTQSDMYSENVLKPLQEWLHSLGMTLRAEPSYGLPFEISTPGKYIDGIEAESYAQNVDFDAFRGFLGSANMYGRTFSSETGAVPGRNYFYDMDYFTQMSYLQFAGGINRTVFHGYSGIEGSDASTAWPGHEGMYPSFSDRFNSRQPASKHYPEWTEMLGRNQKVLRQGQPQRDIAILRTDHAFFAYPGGWQNAISENSAALKDEPLYWQDLSLQHSGYTYDYFSPLLLEDKSNVSWTNKVLQPDGPSYQAVIVYQQAMELTSARALYKIAKDGLPVVFVNNVTERYRSVANGKAASVNRYARDDDAALERVVDRIKALPNVREIQDDAETKATLERLGVQPRVGYDKPNNKVLTQTRLDKANDIFYTWAYSFKYGLNKFDVPAGEAKAPHSFDLVIDRPGKPYQINDWTGEVEPVGVYEIRGGKTYVSLTLQPGEKAIVALDLSKSAAKGNTLHVVSSDADDAVVSGNRVTVTAGQTGSYSAKLSNGMVARTGRVSVRDKVVLPKWNITVEDWNEGEKVTNTEEKFGHTTKEVYFKTKKTPLSFPNSDLVPWKDLPATSAQLAQLSGTNPSMSDVSGLGRYNTTFKLPATWSKPDGAHLQLTSTGGGTVQVTVNGRQVPGFDLRTLRVDVSDFVKPGTNTVEIEVASTLTNRVLTRNYPTVKGVRDYGLTGEVAILPYKKETIPRSDWRRR